MIRGHAERFTSAGLSSASLQNLSRSTESSCQACSSPAVLCCSGVAAERALVAIMPHSSTAQSVAVMPKRLMLMQTGFMTSEAKKQNRCHWCLEFQEYCRFSCWLLREKVARAVILSDDLMRVYATFRVMSIWMPQNVLTALVCGNFRMQAGKMLRFSPVV